MQHAEQSIKISKILNYIKAAFIEIREEVGKSIDNLRLDLVLLHERESTYDRFIKRGFNLLSNLSACYHKYDSSVKQKILGSIFPEKLVITEKIFRTTRIDKAVSLISVGINGLEITENEKAEEISDFLKQAPAAGLEPATL